MGLVQRFKKRKNPLKALIFLLAHLSLDSCIATDRSKNVRLHRKRLTSTFFVSPDSATYIKERLKVYSQVICNFLNACSTFGC